MPGLNSPQGIRQKWGQGVSFNSYAGLHQGWSCWCPEDHTCGRSEQGVGPRHAQALAPMRGGSSSSTLRPLNVLEGKVQFLWLCGGACCHTWAHWCYFQLCWPGTGGRKTAGTGHRAGSHMQLRNESQATARRRHLGYEET